MTNIIHYLEKTKRLYFQVCLVGISLVVYATVPQTALASTRTFCFDGFVFDDGRTNCPSPTADGARRGCSTGSSYMVGAWFDLYDKDSDGNDDFIHRYRIDQSGSFCATFDWEGEPYQSDGELNPDLYVKFINVVQSTSGGHTIRAVDSNWDPHPVTSWRSVSVLNNCTGTCINNDDHILSVDSSQAVGSRMAALDSSQHFLEVYESVMNKDVDMKSPCSSCTGGFASGQDRFKLSQSAAIDASLPPHEMGHVLTMQIFDRDALIDNTCRDVSGETTTCGHTSTSDEWESGATQEGWAYYTSAVSWWDPDNVDSNPVIYSRNIEAAQPAMNSSGGYSCSDNSSRRLQVTKAFWDLDDARPEDGFSPALVYHEDVSNFSTMWVVNGWYSFAQGTTNRKDWEGAPPPGWNGVNVWDYYYNNTYRVTNTSNFVETLLYHNCLQNQTTN